MARNLIRRAFWPRVQGALRPRWPAPPGLFTPRHPLGAGALIRDGEGRVLLILQTYQRPPLWLPPGGWVDRGETPGEAARREVREELGLRVDVGRPLATRDGGYGELTILFDCRLLDDAPIRPSYEIAQAEFFHPDALPPMYDVARDCLLEGLAALNREQPVRTASGCARGS
ncbi:MAG TPA: NUDIX hydrolase [Chloroflexota bacterium]|nr:NUDIX hydrolase [Chloroflexota bacterium]